MRSGEDRILIGKLDERALTCTSPDFFCTILAAFAILPSAMKDQEISLEAVRVKSRLPWILLALAMLFVGLSFVPRAGQGGLFPYDELCDYRMFILPTMQSRRPYEPEGIHAHDACYPPIAYCAVRALVSDRGEKWKLTGGEMQFLASIFVMQALAALLLVRRFQNKSLRVAMACVIIMSPSCICSVLRGNPSGWAFALVCAFLAWYRSENRLLRVIAAVALGMATALKIAPCLFGVLYLSDVFRKPRRIPVLEILLAGSSAVLLVFVPFFFWGGTDSIAQWMANARANAAFYSVRCPIWGFVGFANHFVDSSELVLPSAVWFAAATRIFSGVLVVMSLLVRRTYLKLLFVGAALAFTTHHDYGGAYLLPAFIAWLDASETVQGGVSGLGLLLEAVAWTVVVTPLQVPNPCRPGTMNALLQNEFLFVLLISAFVRIIAQRYPSRR